MASSQPQAIPRRRGNDASDYHEGSPGSSVWQSSLDLVFSYSRAQGFYGTNLPSSPSFVDAEDEVEWEEDRATLRSLEEEGEQWEGDDEAREQWDEELPSNARVHSRSNIHRPNSSQSDERTPLVTPSLPKHSYLSPNSSSFSHYVSHAVRRKDSIALESGVSISIKPAPPPAKNFPVGGSTFGQTLFNSINCLVGVGILAEPLAFAYAGWVGGTIILLFCGLVTNYTAKILAKLMYEDRTLLNYSDIGVKAFGPRSKIFINLIFCLELMAFTTALFVLFGDTMSTLLGGHSNTWKVAGFFIILPTVFLPLSLLSLTSILGILSSFILLAVVLIDGFSKSEQPGSLWNPMRTEWDPDWMRAPLSTGLIMSGFSGHAVMPSLARDLDTPAKFDRMINIAYVVAFVVYSAMGVAGYLMFGRTIEDEITVNLMETEGYNRTLNYFATLMIGINPLAKFALAFRPLAATVEHLLGFEATVLRSRKRRHSIIEGGSSVLVPEAAMESSLVGMSHMSFLVDDGRKKFWRVVVKILCTMLICVIAVVFPGFDRVMSFLGAFSAFVICVIGPVSAYLCIWGPEGKIGKWEKRLDYILLVVAVILAAIGTTFSFMPIKKHD